MKNLSKMTLLILTSRPKDTQRFELSVLSLGKIGYFDDYAVIPSQIFYFNKNYYLFYVGWTQGKTVPYNLNRISLYEKLKQKI